LDLPVETIELQTALEPWRTRASHGLPEPPKTKHPKPATEIRIRNLGRLCDTRPNRAPAILLSLRQYPKGLTARQLSRGLALITKKVKMIMAGLRRKGLIQKVFPVGHRDLAFYRLTTEGVKFCPERPDLVQAITSAKRMDRYVPGEKRRIPPP
jgi:DNA-binding MarR family transcriptional regulator